MGHQDTSKPLSPDVPGHNCAAVFVRCTYWSRSIILVASCLAQSDRSLILGSTHLSDDDCAGQASRSGAARISLHPHASVNCRESHGGSQSRFPLSRRSTFRYLLREFDLRRELTLLRWWHSHPFNVVTTQYFRSSGLERRPAAGPMRHQGGGGRFCRRRYYCGVLSEGKTLGGRISTNKCAGAKGLGLGLSLTTPLHC